MVCDVAETGRKKEKRKGAVVLKCLSPVHVRGTRVGGMGLTWLSLCLVQVYLTREMLHFALLLSRFSHLLFSLCSL